VRRDFSLVHSTRRYSAMAKLSPHWINFHGYGIDEVGSWKSDWVKVVDPNLEQCVRLNEEVGRKILARIFDFGSYDFTNLPGEVALDHINRIVRQEAFGAVDVWETVNEPGSLFRYKDVQWWVRYWIRMIELADQNGVRLCWGNFPPGAPPGVNNEGATNWEPFASVFEAAGIRHILGLHEYWGSGGVQMAMPWWSGRYRFLRKDCDIMITECGIEMGLWLEDGRHSGWRDWVSEEEYLRHLSYYLKMCNDDGRILAAFPFTLDYSNAKWRSFDTRGLGARIGTINDQVKPHPTPAPLPEPEPDPKTDVLKHFAGRVNTLADRVAGTLDELETLRRDMLAESKGG